MKWLITGDTHGQFERFKHLECDAHTAIIILGDVGLNFKMDCHDYWNKKSLVKMCPATFYCVKGNHEARPSEVPNMKLVYDEKVQGEVWVEEEFPTIKYFKEWGIYNIDGNDTLVIGGAYSVDKWLRLENDWPWFPSEQLTQEEMKNCLRDIKNKHFDLVLTHTAPVSWTPIDLFISNVDQSKVDITMECWLNKVSYKIDWGIWLFGHYHKNRVERPHVEMLFENIEDLNNILNRWKQYDETGKIDWWLPKSPNYYMGVQKNEITYN